jgi:cell cycle arrest protein BUB3
MSSSELQINEPPSDAISKVSFCPESSKHLLVSSWDGSVRLYDISSNTLKHTYTHSRAVLDCFYKSESQAYSAGLDKQLKMFDFSAQKELVLGTHAEAIQCVHYCERVNLVITGSWDKFVKLWDPRAPKCVGSYEQVNKVYSMDTCDERLVVATAHRKIQIWNLKNMNDTSTTRDSNLRFQTRSIRCFPNKQGFVTSTIEGRVAVNYFDEEMQRKKYAFKCHRRKSESGQEQIYPVNAIAFNKEYNTFATGGSDGVVNIWDPFNKKRLCQFHPYPAGIVSLAFDSTGSKLAIGSSYHYEEGEKSEMSDSPDNIFIRNVSELETKPK